MSSAIDIDGSEMSGGEYFRKMYLQQPMPDMKERIMMGGRRQGKSWMALQSEVQRLATDLRRKVNADLYSQGVPRPRIGELTPADKIGKDAIINLLSDTIARDDDCFSVYVPEELPTAPIIGQKIEPQAIRQSFKIRVTEYTFILDKIKWMTNSNLSEILDEFRKLCLLVWVDPEKEREDILTELDKMEYYGKRKVNQDIIKQLNSDLEAFERRKTYISSETSTTRAYVPQSGPPPENMVEERIEAFKDVIKASKGLGVSTSQAAEALRGLTEAMAKLGVKGVPEAKLFPRKSSSDKAEKPEKERTAKKKPGPRAIDL